MFEASNNVQEADIQNFFAGCTVVIDTAGIFWMVPASAVENVVAQWMAGIGEDRISRVQHVYIAVKLSDEASWENRQFCTGIKDYVNTLRRLFRAAVSVELEVTVTISDYLARVVWNLRSSAEQKKHYGVGFGLDGLTCTVQHSAEWHTEKKKEAKKVLENLADDLGTIEHSLDMVRGIPSRFHGLRRD